MKLPIVIRIYKNGQLESVKQFSDSQIVIGKTESVQIQLTGDEVAPIHALIEERDTGYYVSDLGSQTGTLFRGKKILDEKIESAESLEIGLYRLDFFIGIPKPVAPPKQEAMPHPVPLIVDEPYPLAPKETPLELLDEPEFLSKTVILPVEPPVLRNESVVVPKNNLSATSEYKIPENRPTVSSSSFSNLEKRDQAKEDKREYALENTRKVVTANNKGTFAPPSEFKNLNEILRPGKGTVIEVIVAWRERILSSNHFGQRGMVRIGSKPDNEIILPHFGGMISHSLVRIDSLATVCVTGDMSGDLINEQGGVKPFSELMKQNRMARNHVGFEISLQQGEMLRVGLQGDLINLYVRYVPEAPKPLVAPLFDLSASEVTGVILAAVVALTFGLYMMIYAPKKLNDENLVEEPMRKAIVVFTPPIKPPPKEEPAEPKVEPVPEKKVVKIVEKKPAPSTTPSTAPAAPPTPARAKPTPVTAAQPKADPGAAAQAKPNPNKTNKKTLTSSREGGAVNTGKSGASPSSEKVDVSKVGLLGTFGSKGTQSKLDKAYSGAGELSGLAESATGFAGQAEDRAGDNIGSKLKSTGAGGKGTATVGIAGVGTTGKGSGTFGYGSGGLGKKSKVEVQVSGQEAEFVGSMDREAIRRVILANKRVIRNCYETALARSPDLYGKLVLQWDIQERGRVGNVTVVSNSLGNKSVAECLIQRLKTWIFPDPPPDQVGRVTYPFVFASQ